jgi:hypothetical protein
MQTEAEFSKQVLKFFREKLTSDKECSDVKVDKEVNILKDFTFGKDKKGNWRPVLGLQQQDIVFYKDAFTPEKFGKEVYITNIGKRGEIVIPLVICELKVSQNFVTHAFLTYSRISQEIKYIFPFCAYYFLLDTNKGRNIQPSTLLRQSKGFDRVFLEWEADKEIIWDDIKKHLEYLKRLKII